MSNDETDLSRRDFIRYSAAASAAAAVWHSTALKTDAVATRIPPRILPPPQGDVIHPYMYHGDDP